MRLTSGLLGVALAVLASSCASRQPQPPRPAPPPVGRPGASATTRPIPPPAGLVLRVETGARGSGVVEAIDLETYVRDVVVGEITVAPRDAALAEDVYTAQAILARTYALAVRGRHAADGFDVCSSTHCQVYARDQWRRSRWAAQVEAAVTRTRGQYLVAAGRPIEAVFHAHCGGHTSAAAEVWRSTGAPYLRGAPDPYCVREQAGDWTSTLEIEVLREALNRRPRTQVGDRLDGVQVLRRDMGGRAVELALSGSRSPVVTAEDFRLAVLSAAGARSLRSARFVVERSGTSLVFSGSGAGHGVGLCQVGLIGRLRAGQSVREALTAYYGAVELVVMRGT